MHTCLQTHILSESVRAGSSALKRNLWLTPVSLIDLDTEMKLDVCSSISVHLVTFALFLEQGIRTMQKPHFLKHNIYSIIQNVLTVASFQNLKQH